jgi:hypothetical protein
MSITSHADNFTCNKMENMDNTFQAVLEINKIKKIEYSNESSVSGMLTITNLSKEWPLYTSECIKPKIGKNILSGTIRSNGEIMLGPEKNNECGFIFSIEEGLCFLTPVKRKIVFGFPPFVSKITNDIDKK